jgi:hypothetical protein
MVGFFLLLVYTTGVKAMSANGINLIFLIFLPSSPPFGLQGWFPLLLVSVAGVKAMNAERHTPRLTSVYPQRITTMIQPTAIKSKINRLRSVNPIHARKR